VALEAICLKAWRGTETSANASAAELAQQVQRWQDDQRRKAEDALRRQSESCAPS